MLEQRYSIKSLTSIKDRDYVEALKIYMKSIPADVRTNTNEIASFVAKPEDSNRKMYFFALYHQGEVIGYAQFALLKKARILFLDYIAFETNYKINSAFYPFMSIIGMYFENEQIECDYWVTEIGRQNDGKSIDEDSAFLRKVISVEDFYAVPALYRQPELGINRQETRVDAQLYIKTSSSIQSLSVDTYLGIVRAIYYSHYVSWYKKILTHDEFESYSQHVDEEYQRIKESLCDIESIELLHGENLCKYYDTTCCPVYGKTSAPIPQIKKRRKKWPFSALAVVATLCCSILFYYLLTYLKISVEHFSGVYAATTTLAIGVTAYYFKEKP